MDMIRRFPPDEIEGALEAWAWVPGLSAMSVVVTSAFGDVFLQASDGVWFLDTVEGTLTRHWDDTSGLQDALNTREGQERFLMTPLAEAAYATGLNPGTNEILNFKVTPVLGGSFEPENVEVVDLSVALHLTGQIHEQIKNLPDGTRINLQID